MADLPALGPVSCLPNGRSFNLPVIRVGTDADDTYTGSADLMFVELVQTS